MREPKGLRLSGLPALPVVMVVAAAATAGLTGCAGGTHDGVAARVGSASITSAAVDHAASVLAGGRLPGDGPRLKTLRAQALESLISAQWALGEAAEDGIRISAQEARRQLEQKQAASFPGGAAEESAFLKATGQHVSDLALEARAELAATKIRQMLERREPAISQAQIASYYNREAQRFMIPERREIDIIALKSPADAQALRRQVEGGKRLASVAEHQWVDLSPLAYGPTRGKDAVLARAIHRAPPHVLTGPVRFRGFDYYMFEVLHVTPARQRTLAQVRDSIAHTLAAERQRRTLIAFISGWRRKWTARTDCRTGYVVQKCRQYTGSRTPEDPAAFS